MCGSYGLPHPVLASRGCTASTTFAISALIMRRLWNRECRIKPLIARAFKAELTPNERVYAQLVVMQILLAKIAPGNHWAQSCASCWPNILYQQWRWLNSAGWASRKIWGLAP